MPPPNKADLWSSGRDETVEVNQRALIDKILARYSGENTIFRELLQNADDAGAQHCQVKFYSEAGVKAHEAGAGPSRLPDVKRDPMYRYVVTNDGIPFRPQDWQRLKKIAEGNPDEEKIGAFGVGFYSLWSICDDPFVESGSSWMGFYWKDGKDQLLARSGDLPPSSSSSTGHSTLTGNPWTSFTMTLREPTLLEGPLDLARFLITSLTFMRTIKKIDMLVDDVKVLEVEKSIRGSTRVAKKGLRSASSGGMMNVVGVDSTGMVITAKVMKWLSATGFVPPPMALPVQQLAKQTKAFTSFLSSSFFNRSSPTPPPAAPPPPPPPPENPLEVTTLSRDIQIYQADIKVTVSPSFGKELERATKKPAPARMPASLVFSRGEEESEDEATPSGSTVAKKDVGDVFGGLCPPLDGEKSAKVFIGQATGQTTGIGGHLAARFIPTVERESIDLVDRHVSHWNKELLWVGGYLSRLIYELEMLELSTAWNRTSVKDVIIREKLLARGLHALRFFTFKTTTPSAVVGQSMEQAFYACAMDNKTLPMVTNIGVLPISQVRMPNAEMQKFIPDLPVITSAVLEDAPRTVARLREQSLLREVTLEDVVTQLATRPLTEKEMIDCLTWWQSIAGVDGYTPQIRARLLDAAILVMDTGKIVPLSVIQTVVKPQSSSLPTDMPLPTHTVPYIISKDLRGNTIYSIFGWTELSLLQYITFLIKPPMSDSPHVDPETDIRSSPAFAEKVLAMLGRAWQSIAANQQTAISLELKDVPCIPTKAGFKIPSEAYFEKNLLFDDLPTIALPKNTAIKGGMEKMLLAIGVRKTVNLQLVFSRLIGGGEWTCADLMKYLVSVKDTLSTDELARLKQTAAFPLEVQAMGDGTKAAVVRQKPHQLYEPSEAMRSLGLPLLDWGDGKWRTGSDEAKMLYALGLRRFPPIDVLLGLAAGGAPTNEKALQYLLANNSNHYIDFDPSGFSGVAFIPATTSSGATFLAKPGEVFTNPQCAILGFAIAHTIVSSPENAGKLKIPTDPSMDRLVQALLSVSLTDIGKARSVFEYMATRVGHSGGNSLERLQSAAFVPIKAESGIRLIKPNEVYFAPKDGGDSPFRSAFTFVDFGERANVFLRYCGVRSEPSVKDIARLLMREPQRMLDQAGSPDKYLEQLRLLAANWTNFDASTRLSMKTAAFVLASQRVPVKKVGKKLFGGSSGGDDEYEREWVLCKASNVAVVDDITMLQYFGRHILAAPEEHLLETFYEHLGAKTLSSLVKTEYVTSHTLPSSSDQAKQLRQHVLERLTIFLAEARRRSSEYTVEALSKEGNFIVTEVRDLKARYIYRNGRNEYSHLETLYATTSRSTKGKAITLTVSVTAQPDDYDIAASLCGILLKVPKADDALLLYSILSTPLMALKKRGFNVDRILNSQREERLRIQAETARDREKLAAEAAARPPPPYTSSDSDDKSVKSEGSKVSLEEESSFTGGKTKTLLDRLRRGSKDTKGAASQLLPPVGADGAVGGKPQLPSMGESSRSGGLGMMGGNGLGGMSGGGGGGGNTTKRPTNLDNIRATVQKAVDASRPEMNTQIRDSRQAVKDVSESQGEYCDASAQADIVLAMNSGPSRPKIWVPRDVQDHQGFLSDKMDICQRFARDVLLPIGEVYRLSVEVMNIFWDHEGPLIAFNRAGAIFCNARYFAAWHDVNCRNNDKNDAFISWYFSIAHEIAHNLESAHNSSHEFYFSSIAEEYLVRFTTLLHSDVD